MPRVYNKWTIQDDDWLEENYNKSTPAELLERFPGRKLERIVRRASFIGVAGKRYRFTEEEDEIIRQQYNKLGAKKLHKLMPRHSPKSILNRANSMLGVRKNSEPKHRGQLINRIAKKLKAEFEKNGV